MEKFANSIIIGHSKYFTKKELFHHGIRIIIEDANRFLKDKVAEGVYYEIRYTPNVDYGLGAVGWFCGPKVPKKTLLPKFRKRKKGKGYILYARFKVGQAYCQGIGTYVPWLLRGERR